MVACAGSNSPCSANASASTASAPHRRRLVSESPSRRSAARPCRERRRALSVFGATLCKWQQGVDPDRLELVTHRRIAGADRLLSEQSGHIVFARLDQAQSRKTGEYVEADAVIVRLAQRFAQ